MSDLRESIERMRAIPAKWKHLAHPIQEMQRIREDPFYDPWEKPEWAVPFAPCCAACECDVPTPSIKMNVISACVDSKLPLEFAAYFLTMIELAGGDYHVSAPHPDKFAAIIARVSRELCLQPPIAEPIKKRLPTIAEMSGLVHDFTNGKPLKEYMEELSDE